MNPLRVGVIGCGAISGAYLGIAKKFAVVDIIACADIDPARASEAAAKFGIARSGGVDELFAMNDVELVLNLTVPKAHADVSLHAIEAGKHVYLEKPLGIHRADGERILTAAKSRGVRVGCAPDTFLGAGIQTARKAIDDGSIGRPVAFTAFMMGAGHESWHPNPGFYYEAGGGPMFDMGPYYLTALLNLLGPIKRVSGAASIAIPVRTITSEPRRGQLIHVQTPDHVMGSIDFASGALGMIITSFATRFAGQDGRNPITIFGTEGTLRVPDPNGFDGPVYLRRNEEKDWSELPPPFASGYGRSVGLADMAIAIRNDGPIRASGEQAFAVLDAMQAFLDSAKTGHAIDLKAPYQRPEPMPLASAGPFGSNN